jgi:hypothetical protein
MNPTTLELALKKQRLQIASEGLRGDFGRHAAGLMPIFSGADFAVDGARWMRRNPQIVIAAGRGAAGGPTETRMALGAPGLFRLAGMAETS